MFERILPTLTVFLIACGTGSIASPQLESTNATESSEMRTTPGGDPAAAAGLPSDCADGDEGPPAPSTPAALNQWLQARTYRCWARESHVHRSAGPHSGNVRTYLNKAIDASLHAGEPEHPAGSTAVKELYRNGTSTVMGWAALVKTASSSADGDGWYWYEVFSAEPGAGGAIEGHGKPLCVNCHAAGRDFVRIPHPLQ